MTFASQLVKAANEFSKIDWNLYDIRLTKLELALAGKDDAKRQRLEKRLERLQKVRAKTIWLKK
jgi:hypothetical protein